MHQPCIYIYIYKLDVETGDFLFARNSRIQQDLKLDASLTYFAQLRRREKLTLRNYEHRTGSRKEKACYARNKQFICEEVIVKKN